MKYLSVFILLFFGEWNMIEAQTEKLHRRSFILL